jgi:hypothetical protein
MSGCLPSDCTLFGSKLSVQNERRLEMQAELEQVPTLTTVI